MKFNFSLLFAFLFSLAAFTFAEEPTEQTQTSKPPANGAPKSGNKWKGMKMDDIEKEWEKGDEAVELEEEFEYIRKIHQTKVPKVNMNDGQAIRDAYNNDPFLFGGSGGMMVFVDLKGKQPDGKEWNKDAVDHLSRKYSSLLRTGSLPTTIYNLGENRMLVNLEKSWHTKDVLKFLAEQPEVDFFTANSKKYTAEEFLERDDDEEL